MTSRDRLDNRSAPEPQSTIGAGGPGFAPDFAGAPSGRAEFAPARQAGNLTDLSRDSFDRSVLEKFTLKPAGETEEENEGHRRALSEREDSGTPGPHHLNRAFSGSYPEER